MDVQGKNQGALLRESVLMGKTPLQKKPRKEEGTTERVGNVFLEMRSTKYPAVRVKAPLMPRAKQKVVKLSCTHNLGTATGNLNQGIQTGSRWTHFRVQEFGETLGK